MQEQIDVFPLKSLTARNCFSRENFAFKLDSSKELLFYNLLPHICSGTLSDRSKPIVFSMARLDHVKNMTGLVECYGKNSQLRELVNLVVVAGYIDVNKSKDREEIAEIEKMHELMKTYKLDGQFRWIAAQTNRARNGELYRYIADTKGAFVQVYVHPIPLNFLNLLTKYSKVL